MEIIVPPSAEISLTPEQVKDLYQKYATDSIQVIMYDEIINAINIDDLFKYDNKIIIFYPSLKFGNQVMGHYTALILNNRTIYYYDPLAYFIDGYKKTSDMRDSLYNEQYNSLIKLLIESNYKVDYNNHQHQSRSSKIATCGRHSILRAILNDLSNEQYNDMLKRTKKKYGFRDKYFDKLIVELIN